MAATIAATVSSPIPCSIFIGAFAAGAAGGAAFGAGGAAGAEGFGLFWKASKALPNKATINHNPTNAQNTTTRPVNTIATAISGVLKLLKSIGHSPNLY